MAQLDLLAVDLLAGSSLPERPLCCTFSLAGAPLRRSGVWQGSEGTAESFSFEFPGEQDEWPLVIRIFGIDDEALLGQGTLPISRQQGVTRGEWAATVPIDSGGSLELVAFPDAPSQRRTRHRAWVQAAGLQPCSSTAMATTTLGCTADTSWRPPTSLIASAAVATATCSW